MHLCNKQCDIHELRIKETAMSITVMTKFSGEKSKTLQKRQRTLYNNDKILQELASGEHVKPLNLGTVYTRI